MPALTSQLPAHMHASPSCMSILTPLLPLTISMPSDPTTAKQRACHVHCAAVGADVAEAILQVYPTPLSLFRAYEAAISQAQARGGSPLEEASELLLNIHVGPGPAIGPVRSRKVFTTLFANAWLPGTAA